MPLMSVSRCVRWNDLLSTTACPDRAPQVMSTLHTTTAVCEQAVACMTDLS